MTAILWLAAIALIVIGIAGTILPALPGVILVFGGIVLAAGIDDFAHIPAWLLVLLGAAIGEYLAQRDVRRAGKVGIATWIDLLLSTAAKVAIVFAMVGIFVFALLA